MPDRAVYAIGALGSIGSGMQRTDFHFELPAELIAQRPATPRSASRLLALDGASGALARSATSAICRRCCAPADLLVFNDTRVCRRAFTARRTAAGRIELLLERVLECATRRWCMRARARV